ncbi:MAG: NAD(P)-dependent oxidoreductase [Gemmatimonadaceae bacterium]
MEHAGDALRALRDARLFITGGTGFFGTWLAESLLFANARLGLGARATLLTRDAALFRARAPHIANDAAITLHEDDVRSFRAPGHAFSHVIHAAAESSVQQHADDHLLMFDTIVDGTRRALELAATSGGAPALLVSTGAIYGSQPVAVTHQREDAAGAPDLANPASAYAEGKRAAELLGAVFTAQRGVPVTIARCFAFVGPGLPLDAHFAIGNLLGDVLAGRPPSLRGDGTPRRSYLYAADLAVWLWTILLRGVPARAYNVGSEEDHSLADIAASVARVAGERRPLELGAVADPGRPATRYIPSTARAREELGLVARIGLDDAIGRTLAWHRGVRHTTDVHAFASIGDRSE